MPRVIAEYSDEKHLFDPPEHNGRTVIDVEHNRVESAKYSRLPNINKNRKKTTSNRKPKR